MQKSRPVLGDSLARGLAKRHASSVAERLNWIVTDASRHGTQKRQAKYRRVLSALTKAGAVCLEHFEESKHNSIAYFLAPSLDGKEGTWDLFGYETSRHGDRFIEYEAGFTTHVVQRAIQSGIKLNSVGRVLLAAIESDKEKGGRAWLNGWYASDIGLFRLDSNRIVTVIAKDVLEEPRQRLHERAVDAGGWFPDVVQPEMPEKRILPPADEDDWIMSLR